MRYNYFLLLFAILCCISNSFAQYCAVSGADCSANDRFILSVNIGDLNNTSSCSSNGYSDFSVLKVNLLAGQGYYLTIETNPVALPQSANNQMYGWIDWNQDSIFDESTEALNFIGQGSQGMAGENGLYTAVVLVPATSDSGAVMRMRLRHTFINIPGVFDNNVTPCGADTIGEIEDYSIVINVPPTTYCIASGGSCAGVSDSSSADFDHIKTVSIPHDNTTLVNNSGCDNGYGDFTSNQTLWAYWTRGNSYNVVLKRVVSDYITAKASAFVDWNSDKDFSDASENYGGIANPLDSSTTFLINAPSFAVVGQIRLRLRTTSSTLTNASACGTQLYGEVEDYTVIIVDTSLHVPSCAGNPIPANGAGNLCQKLTLAWDKDSLADGYRLNLWQDNPSTFIVVDSILTDTNFIPPFALDTNKSYSWTLIPFNTDGDAFNCDTLHFTVSSDPDPTTRIIPDFDTIFQCISTVLPMDGDPQNGTAPYTHSWNGTDNTLLSDTSVSNPAFFGAPSGEFDYSYTVTDSKGCNATDKVHISIVPAVDAGIIMTDDTVLCENQSTIFTHSAFSGNVEIQDSIAGNPWVTITLIQPEANRYSTGLLSQTTWFRIITNAGSCADTSTAILIEVVSKPAIPIIVAGGPTIFCDGDSVMLSVNNYTDGLSWNDPDSTNALSIQAKLNRSYEVAYADVNGCASDTASIVITVNPVPAKPVILFAGNASACAGDTVTIYINNPDMDFITWNDSLFTVGDSLVVSDPGTYQATAEKNGCTSVSGPITLLFNFEPVKPIVTRTGKAQPCDGDSLILTSSYTSGITWSDGSTTTSILVSTPDKYYVTFTDSGGCSSVSDTVNAMFTPIPAKPVITMVGDSLMADVPGYIYQWIGPQGPIYGANKQFFKPTKSGIYWVYAYTHEGCGSEQSLGYYIGFTGISDYEFQELSYFPNPVKDKLFITSASSGKMSITSILGQELIAKEFTAGFNQIELSQLPAGSYLIHLTTDTANKVHPLIKE